MSSIGREAGPQPWDTYSKTETDNLKVAKVSSTDNAIVRFDGTSGAVQNSSVVIDDSGNVGISVTPSGWYSPYKALQLNDTGALFAQTGYNVMGLVSNAYFDGSNYRYLTTNGSKTATRYVQTSGMHLWDTAPSGTAGNAITWNTAMSLTNNGLDINATFGGSTFPFRVGYTTSGTYYPAFTINDSGNVGIGTTSPSSTVGMGKFIQVSHTTAGGFNTKNTTSGIETELYSGTASAYLQTTSNHPLSFGTGNIERMRIDSSGNVGIGTSSPNYKITLGGQTGATSTPLALRFSNDFNSGTSASGSKIFLYNDGNTGQIYGFGVGSAGDVQYHAGSAGISGTFSHRWYTADIERMRIDSSGNLLFNSGYGSAATAYGCRAWVNFNGTGTVAIRASGNVSSITDNGVGNYMVNITTAMPDTNYSISGICSSDVDQGGESIRIDTARGTSIYTNSIRLGTSYKAGYFDASYVTISVFR